MARDIDGMIDAVLDGQAPDAVISERKLWVKTVKTRWEPPADLFTKGAAAIAKGLAVAPTLKTAMSRLLFYINRAGKNLPAERQAELEKAKDKLRALYKKKR
jgi:hypothetical protein